MYLSQTIKVPFHCKKKISLLISLRHDNMQGGKKETCKDTKEVSEEDWVTKSLHGLDTPPWPADTPPCGSAYAVVIQVSELKKWPVRAEYRQGGVRDG